MYPLSATFLILSGTAALTYQVSWVRLLGLSMGSTSAAISTVLAAFFLGMALGSYATERITKNRIHNLTPYIILEAIIAVSGLALLPILLNLDSLIAGFGDASTYLSTKFFLTMSLLLIPTICMGATFPVMAGILVRRQHEIGVRVSQLYSLNTLGAVFGALFSGFWFIPNYGLDGAIYIAVSLNMVIVIMGLFLNRRLRLPPLQEEDTTTRQDNFADYPLVTRRLALITLFATGFVSIATEVGWTKYLSVFTGTTIYGFAAILAIFLFGISLGAWLVRNHFHRIRHPATWLAVGLASLALLFLLTRGGLSLIPVIYEGINHMTVAESSRQLIKYLIIFLLLFPSTVILGAIFPINLRLYCGDLQGVRSRVGRAYAVNTLASIAGSLAAGFWIIPLWGTDALLTAMAFITLLVALSFLWITAKTSHRVAVASVALVTIVSHFTWPHIDYREMIASVDYQFDDNASKGEEAKFLFLKEGKVSVISLATYDGRYAKVQANGLNESMIDMKDESNALIIESLLAYMPYFLHPQPKSAFIVGYGGGITTRAFTHTEMESVRVVELEPAVVDAGKSLENGPAKALKDPRVRLEFNDARNTLLVEDQRYDVISAQASHPWLAGASNVFTQEFFEIVKSRLNEGGYYTQWVNLFRMDVTTLRAIFKSFLNVFPNVISFANLETGDYMLVGSLAPIVYDYERVAQRMNKPAILAALSHHGVYGPQDLLWYFALTQDELIKAAGDATPNLDTNILSEVRLSSMSSTFKGDENPYPFLYSHYNIGIEQYLPSDVNAVESLYKLGNAYLRWDTPLNTAKLINRLTEMSPEHGNTLQHSLYYWQHNFEEATKLFESGAPLLDDAALNQISIYYQTKKSRKIPQIFNRIQSQSVRQVARTKFQFLSSPARVPTQLADDEMTKLWQLGAQLRSGQREASDQLVLALDKDTVPTPILRVLSSHLLLNGTPELSNLVLNRLSSQVKSEVKRYVWLFDTALEAEDSAWAVQLLAAIKQLDPENEKLNELTERFQASIL